MGRTALLALIGIPVSVLALVVSLVTYSLIDAPAAAWVAVGALLATLLLAFIAQMAARA